MTEGREGEWDVGKNVTDKDKKEYNENTDGAYQRKIEPWRKRRS